MAIDRMDWHYGGEFPKDLPDENAGTHIGMFLAWIINKHLEGEFHQEDSSEALEAVRSRQMTGREFLIQMCDEKLWDEDLNEEGLAFTEYYYNDDKRFFNDYGNALTQNLPTIYHVEDTWENYDRVAPVFTTAYEEWKANQKP